MQNEAGRPRRKPRAKRPPRVDDGHRFNFRVSLEEAAHLTREAGELGVSAYIRARLFGGGVRHRNGLRKIAALHVLGRRIQQLGESPAADATLIAETLGAVTSAIARLAEDLPGADDEDLAET